MDYMLFLYKNCFVAGPCYQVGQVSLLRYIYYCGIFLFLWDCFIGLNKLFIPLRVWGFFWLVGFFVLFIFSSACLEVCMRDPDGENHDLFCSSFSSFPFIWTLLRVRRCILFLMAHLKAEEHGEPGTDQNIDQGRGRKWFCRSIL